MDVGAEPDIVGEVPADVVGVFKNRDVVAVPEPVVAVSDIKGGDAEVEATEPEAAGTATGQTPDMASTEAAAEVAMLPGMIEVEPGIIASLIVADPLAVVVDMRRFGMAFAVTKGLLGRILMWRLARVGVRGWRAMARYEATAYTVASSVVAMLRPKGQAENQRKSEKLKR